MIKGIVQAVACEDVTGKFGPQKKVKIKVGDAWYSGFIKPSEWPTPPLREGDTVAFEVVRRGEYDNIKAPISVATSVPNPAVKGQSSAYSGSNLAGVKVGHALNNAVQLAIASGDTSLKTIYDHAVTILNVGYELENRFDSIIKAAAERKHAAAEKVKAVPKVEPTPAPATDTDFDDEVPFM